MRFGFSALLLAAMTGSTQADQASDAYWAAKRAESAAYWNSRAADRRAASAELESRMNADKIASEMRKARNMQQQSYYQPTRTYMLQQMPNRTGYWLYGW